MKTGKRKENGRLSYFTNSKHGRSGSRCLVMCVSCRKDESHFGQKSRKPFVREDKPRVGKMRKWGCRRSGHWSWHPRSNGKDLITTSGPSKSGRAGTRTPNRVPLGTSRMWTLTTGITSVMSFYSR